MHLCSATHFERRPVSQRRIIGFEKTKLQAGGERLLMDIVNLVMQKSNALQNLIVLL